jgi:hypothetical protein
LEALRERYKDVPFVKTFLGSSVSYDDMDLYQDFEEVWNSRFNKIRTELYSKELVKSWFDRDMETIQNSPVFLNHDIESYDGVLIDGGEFTGIAELHYLADKAKVLFLDDVHHAFKCYEVYVNLLNDDEYWELLVENPNVRNGFAIFLNKKKHGSLL